MSVTFSNNIYTIKYNKYEGSIDINTLPNRIQLFLKACPDEIKKNISLEGINDNSCTSIAL